ncbi:hypothetical protein CEXT_264981 [Caerostris extrusa]|uniref:Uncharacterized protein n=1 Tax=Caerostris extrusa TaxID=172846 RepID=A0AAV4NVQ9_CAEEX|nr:hypothetical protein CEXT_264981 [Caerostris extrusa]
MIFSRAPSRGVAGRKSILTNETLIPRPPIRQLQQGFDFYAFLLFFWEPPLRRDGCVQWPRFLVSIFRLKGGQREWPWEDTIYGSTEIEPRCLGNSQRLIYQMTVFEE